MEWPRNLWEPGASEDDGPQLVAIFANFQEIAAFRFRQGSIGPIIDDQYVDLGQASQKAAQAAVGAGQGQIAEQLGYLTKGVSGYIRFTPRGLFRLRRNLVG